MTDNTKMREDFEKWARDNLVTDTHALGTYWKMYKSMWQAAQSYCPSPDPVKLAELGWQMIECPICGGGAQAFPQQAAQSVPVVGEPTDAAYKWMIANGVEPLTSLHKLGERLAAFLDEDQFSECEALLLTAITAINTFVPVPAAELATLREKAAEADELRKDAEIAVSTRNIALNALQEIIDIDYQANLADAKLAATKAMKQSTAIAQGKGE